MNRIAVVLLAGAVLLLAATSAQGQSDPYFQWMNAITDDTLTPRMAAHLSAAGVIGKEQEQVAAILKQFKDAEARLEASDGPNAANNSFYSMQEALVQATIAKLKVLTSFQHIDARVQHEAANIVAAKVQRQHPMLMNVSMPAQLPPPMTPNYSLYHTTAMGPAIAPLTASMLTNPNNGGTSFPQWNAANLVDGNTSDVGFATDGVPGGGETGLWVDFGANPATITGINLYMSAANYTGQFSVWYSDGTGYTQVTSHLGPAQQGWNETIWGEFGAHRFWVMNLDVAGSGATINEIQLIQTGTMLHFTSTLTGSTSCPKGCSSAQHQGTVTNSLGSNVSGPYIAPTQYMRVVNAQSQFLPGDGDGSSDSPDPTVGTGGVVLCTQSGTIQSIPTNYLDTQRERAITFSYISSIIDSNGMHPEAYFCSNLSSPPDWPGPDQAYPHVPSGQVVNIAFLFREYVHGTNPKGLPWIVYYPTFLPHLGIGYYVKNTFNAPSCTNWDAGFQNLSLPVPLIPQP